MTDTRESKADANGVERRAPRYISRSVLDVEPEKAIEVLADAGLLTERQAEAYVYRHLEGLGRQETAEKMGLQPATLDDFVADAEKKLETAEQTIIMRSEIVDMTPPDTCDMCDDQVGSNALRNVGTIYVCEECLKAQPTVE